MELFLIGVFCGCILTLLCKKVWRWLSIRILPARYLQAHTVRRRHTSSLKKETDSGE